MPLLPTSSMRCRLNPPSAMRDASSRSYVNTGAAPAHAAMHRRELYATSSTPLGSTATDGIGPAPSAASIGSTDHVAPPVRLASFKAAPVAL